MERLAVEVCLTEFVVVLLFLDIKILQCSAERVVLICVRYSVSCC